MSGVALTEVMLSLYESAGEETQAQMLASHVRVRNGGAAVRIPGPRQASQGAGMCHGYLSTWQGHANAEVDDPCMAFGDSSEGD